MKNRRICVAIGEANEEHAISLAQEAANGLADVVEIRIDYIEKPDVGKIIESIDCPLLFTNRADWEGGLFSGNEEERLELLTSSIEQGASYVDLELKSPKSSLNRLQTTISGKSTKLIVSSHDFEKTPPGDDLLDILTAMKDCGADIGKIITTANDQQDALRVLKLQEEAWKIDLPLIAFCMGAQGIITRIATCDLGGYMTYCSMGSAAGTAPGQINVQDIRKIFTLF